MKLDVAPRRARKAHVLPRDEQGRLIIDPYARLSLNPNGELEKIQTQHADNEQTIGRLGHAVGKRLTDDSLSAWQPRVHRPDWEELLVRLETGLSAGVAIWNIDRLVRRSIDLEKLLALRDELGIKLIDVNGEIDNDFTLRVLVAHAQESSKDTSRRIQRRFAAKRSMGVLLPTGPRAFGWPGMVRPNGKKKRAPECDEVVAAEQEALKWAFDAVLRGVSLAKVAKAWNEAGLLGFYGKPWHMKSVALTMQKQRHAGRIEHRGVVVGEIADHEPTIDPEVFDRVQAKFAARKRGRPAGKTNVGSGLIHHSACGAPMRSRPRYRRSGEAIPTYRCNPPEGCNGMQIDQEPVDKVLREFVIQRLSDPAVAKRASKNLAAQQDRIEQVREELATARETEVMLAAKVGAGQMSPAAFGAAYGPTFERVQALQAELNQLDAAMADTAATETQARVEVCEDWDAASAAGDTERMRRMLKIALGSEGRVEILPAQPWRTGEPRPDPMERVHTAPPLSGIGNTTRRVGFVTPASG